MTQNDAPERGRRPGTARIGTLVGVEVFVSSTWVVVALLFTVGLAPAIERAQPGMGGLKYVAGAAFVVLFYLSVLLHEMSHAVAAKRYGIPVHSITLTFFGGATEIDGEPERPSQEFWIAFVGPVTSIAVGVVLIPVVIAVDAPLLDLAVRGLAATNIVVGLLNLVPGLPFDGGRVLRSAIWAATGQRHRSTVIAGWVGRVVAVAVGLWPVAAAVGGANVSNTDLIFMPVLGFFLWQAASASIVYGTFRDKLPALQARALARRSLVLPGDLPLAEAIRRAQDEQAGGMVALGPDGHPQGIVNELAVQHIPEERRPWVPISSVTRTLEPGLVLAADLDGDRLLQAMQRTPATEYLLLEKDGSIFGVLATADVDRAFSVG